MMHEKLADAAEPPIVKRESEQLLIALSSWVRNDLGELFPRARPVTPLVRPFCSGTKQDGLYGARAGRVRKLESGDLMRRVLKDGADPQRTRGRKDKPGARPVIGIRVQQSSSAQAVLPHPLAPPINATGFCVAYPLVPGGLSRVIEPFEG